MKQFIDTAPFIYLIEGHPIFADKVIEHFSKSLSKGNTFETSVITLMEFGVKPAKQNQQAVIDKFKKLLQNLNIQLSTVDENIAQKAYQLRAKYKFLKGMDAIQIATALELNCTVFVTNDKALKKIVELPILKYLDKNK